MGYGRFHVPNRLCCGVFYFLLCGCLHWRLLGELLLVLGFSTVVRIWLGLNLLVFMYCLWVVDCEFCMCCFLWWWVGRCIMKGEIFRFDFGYVHVMLGVIL